MALMFYLTKFPLSDAEAPVTLKPLVMEVQRMRVQNEGEKYMCEVCGNEVQGISVWGGELFCCKKPMELVD